MANGSQRVRHPFIHLRFQNASIQVRTSMNSPPNAIDNQPVLPVDVDLYADLPAFPPQWPGASTYQTTSVPSLVSQITQPSLTFATPTSIPPRPAQGMSTLPYTGPSMMSSSTCTR